MSDNQRFAIAIHLLLVLAHTRAMEPKAARSSRELSQSIEANPVVVRRVMAMLAEAGIIKTRTGMFGGAWLAKPAWEISTAAVYKAVEPHSTLKIRKGCPEHCPVARAAPGLIAGLAARADAAVAGALEGVTIADLEKSIVA
ncbi:MAG: Rrf2 family transcriptional regulator [Alphaproteobacteria bacterium]|nr:Rrf2 family transcriptional regulator [Alphaproteobacteria bacterium]